jgi:hypothetical protein
MSSGPAAVDVVWHDVWSFSMRTTTLLQAFFLAGMMALPGCGGTSVDPAGSASPAKTADTADTTGPADPPPTRVAPLTVVRMDPSIRTDHVAPMYDAANDRIRLFGFQGDFGFVERSTSPGLGMPANFSVYGRSNGDVVRGVTPTGAGAVVAASITDDSIQRAHSRIGATDLPNSGSATFTGTYAGVLNSPSGSVIFYERVGLIRGDATLTADFDAATISGRITDRIDSRGITYNPLDLTQSGIDPTDGSFGASTSGGLSTQPGYISASGSYEGLIVGAQGQETVGGVTLEHGVNSTGLLPYVEMGGFVASR